MRRFSLALRLALVLSLAPLAAHANVFPHGAAASSGGGNFATFVAAQPHNSWLKITASTDGNWNSAALALTRANFDGGTTWASDAAVAAAAMAGCGPNTNGSAWGYSKAAINPTSLKVLFTGGGHAGTCDSGLYELDLNSAPSASWVLKVPSARYLDQYTTAKPAWSNQCAGTAPTGPNQIYWATTNKDGVEMPISTHVYANMVPIPGSNKFGWSGGFGWAASADTCMGSAYVFDDQNLATNDGMTGPVTIPVSGFWYASSNGYAGATTSGPSGVAWNDQDGLPYTAARDTSNNTALFKITSPYTNGSAAATRVGASNLDSADNGTHDDQVIFPDPINGSGQRAYFVACTNTASCTNKFALWTGIGGTVAYTSQTTYASAVTYASADSYGWSYDTARGQLTMSDGTANLFKVVPNATPSTWTLASFTSTATCAGADCPSVPAGAGNNMPRIQYIASTDSYVMCNFMECWSYRP